MQCTCGKSGSDLSLPSGAIIHICTECRERILGVMLARGEEIALQCYRAKLLEQYVQPVLFPLAATSMEVSNGSGSRRRRSRRPATGVQMQLFAEGSHVVTA
jgi:hypothetical protein